MFILIYFKCVCLGEREKREGRFVGNGEVQITRAAADFRNETSPGS